MTNARPGCGICLCLLLSISTGCALGPRQIYHGRLEYNEAVQKTFQEEMLLNLVRLKYRENPEFLSVGGIAAQYSFDGGTGASLTQPEGGAGILGLNGFLSRSERPTISYVPARGEAFQRGLLAPIDLESLQLLARTGWSWERIFRTTVQYMNEVDNATSAGGPTPDLRPQFEEFLYLARLMRTLQQQRSIELVSVNRPTQPKLLPFTKDELGAASAVELVKQGYRIQEAERGIYLQKDETQLSIVVAPEAKHSEELREIARLLHLRIEPEPRSPVVVPLKSANQGRIIAGLPRGEALPAPGMSGGWRDDVVVSTRSLLEVMYYLSQGIQIPPQHVSQGLVTLTVDHYGQPFDWSELTSDLLNVMSCKRRPKNAQVAVRYKGYWFYIDDRDLNSQSTFNLLVELFGIEIRAGGGGGFFYTLNVGG